MSRILAIDSASEICSVALTGHHEPLLLSGSGRRQHARQLLPLIETLLEQGGVGLQELDALAIVQGPGSFTGLRIGSSVAQGLAFTAGLPVVRVSSLALLAAAANRNQEAQPVLACLQARAGEFYWASYLQRQGHPLLYGREQAGPASSVRPDAAALREVSGAGWLGAGDGWSTDALQPVAGEFGITPEPEVRTDAALLARLALDRFAEGEAVSPEHAVPVYIKDEMDYRKLDRN